MDARDVMLNLCNEMIETNKHCRELGRICKNEFIRQARINRRTSVWAIAALVSIVIVEDRRKKMQKEIDILKKEVKELKSAKEE